MQWRHRALSLALPAPRAEGKGQGPPRPWAPVRGSPLALLALGLLPLASAHEEHERLEEQLVQDGEAVLIGRFGAPQPGALVVVPYLDGPLPCGEPAEGATTMGLGPGASVRFLSNASHVGAVLDVPRDGYAGFAVDTHSAARTLILMQEQAVALHRLAAAVLNGSGASYASGVLGIPYALPGASAHSLYHPQEGGGVRMAYDEAPGPGSACASGEPGHATLAFARTELPGSLAPGSVVHAVALYDPELPRLLPLPLPSTRVAQANLYLARPGEDAAMLRAAFASAPGVQELGPLLLLAGGLGWAARRP